MPDISKPTFYILVALYSGPKHGYTIIKIVHELSLGDVAMGPGTLYGALKRLLEDGLIEEVQKETSRGKRHYQLTDKGRNLLKLETERLEIMIRASKHQFTMDIA